MLTHPELATMNEGKVRLRWSPAQISRYLKATFPDDAGTHLSHESIYVGLSQQKSTICCPAKLTAAHRRGSPQGPYQAGHAT